MWPTLPSALRNGVLAPGTRFAVAQSGLVRHNGITGIRSR